MAWDINSLSGVFGEDNTFVVSKEGECLIVTNEDGVDAFVSVCGSQIVMEVSLFAASSVSDVNVLNAEILKTHQLLPLSSICVSEIDGTDYYLAFGALSSESKAETINIEVETLFQNVPDFLEAYRDHLK
ncbi:MAG: YjfI family protein [Pseudomonadales bacterium]|nr:YjfI family protein [Pseudomonadales bacterium]